MRQGWNNLNPKRKTRSNRIENLLISKKCFVLKVFCFLSNLLIAGEYIFDLYRIIIDCVFISTILTGGEWNDFSNILHTLTESESMWEKKSWTNKSLCLKTERKKTISTRNTFIRQWISNHYTLYRHRQHTTWLTLSVSNSTQRTTHKYLYIRS